MTAVPAFYGQIQIRSTASVADPLVGITSGGTFATVSLGQADTTWTVTTQPDGNGLRFSIGDYPYTGLEDGTTVIATTDASQDVAWNVTYASDNQAYQISPWAQWDKGFWTVQYSTESDSPIILRPLDGSSYRDFEAVQLGGD